ncbi:hypothetical protein C4D60_Mb08t05540 [Musa balbisiana]|uniref:Uncharacterized protein n=1 Tax=Musa balbisiana TaxID=52838 RepID=A0A4S8K1K3_MUSBA|nr:hypothetical protein C4D60_Mb08t05540 [Musa balbisiana]
MILQTRRGIHQVRKVFFKCELHVLTQIQINVVHDTKAGSNAQLSIFQKTNAMHLARHTSHFGVQQHRFGLGLATAGIRAVQSLFPDAVGV